MSNLRYKDLIHDEIDAKVHLTKHEQDAILFVHDYGIEILDENIRHELNNVLFALKNVIWP